MPTLIVSQIDLRWGLTDTQVQSGLALSTCLAQVASSHLFLGLVGTRYGSCVNEFDDSTLSMHGWLKYQPFRGSSCEINSYQPLLCSHIQAGKSVTELEMLAGALHATNEAADRCVFAVRSDDFTLKVRSLPKLPQGV